MEKTFECANNCYNFCLHHHPAKYFVRTKAFLLPRKLSAAAVVVALVCCVFSQSCGSKNLSTGLKEHNFIYKSKDVTF